MKKYIFPVLLSIIVGFFTTKFMFDQYTNKEKLVPTFGVGENVYFIQQGIYSSTDSVKEHLKNFNNYVYTIINGKYYVFIGITKNQDVVKKMQEFYSKKGYITYVKEFKVKTSEFLLALDNFDAVLKETTDEEVIQNIINQTIAKYKELVVDNG